MSDAEQQREQSRAFELRMPADATLGVSVRVFVSEAARRLGLGDADVEDLRLVATELLANAVETHQASVRLGLRVEEGRWYLRARGAGTLAIADDGLVDRGDVLRALADVQEVEGDIEVSSPVTPPDPHG